MTEKTSTHAFAPGSLVRVRGREWITLPGSSAETLRLRPLSGSEHDVALIHTAVEPEIEPATFAPPTIDQEAGQESALLLRDAMLLSLRRGAGPFRSFGNLAVEPRAYQLVPLLMALRLDPVRLLIADDVGVGKTIEAGLILRELLDRGEVARCAVLCPPHLVDQWVHELRERFHLQATAVTATSAGRLERGLPVNESIFSVHDFTVVSLDYIKSARRRDDFVRACPEFVIVDEAHTCVDRGSGQHLRYELLGALSASESRHLLLLTATPHSGDESAFYRLLGLIDPQFERLEDAEHKERDQLRERLSRHFVQRRRPDIDEWRENPLFPQREVAELTYALSGPWQRFFDAVLDYCAERVRASGEDALHQRLTFWGTLALMRCVSSSPAAALRALRTRLPADPEGDPAAIDRVLDGGADALPEDDLEPGADSGDSALATLRRQAEQLAGLDDDPKLRLVAEHVSQLVSDGFSPVVFCRYIATAHYVAHHLRARLPDHEIGVVTGELPSDERAEAVERLTDAEGPRILVATDCLSEGVNLQEAFDAVVHYDLSWNPTRHEQREGRVDRYGQTSPRVRATLLYGENNPVDGAVLHVILRKAESIRRELGVPVPMPDDGQTLPKALMRAVMLRRGDRRQGDLFADLDDTPEVRDLTVNWTSLAEKAKRNRTVFAQRRLRPDDVIPEWKRMQESLGSRQDVVRFAHHALARLGAPLQSLGSRAHPRAVRLPLAGLPPALRERLAADGLVDAERLDFDVPPLRGARHIHRSHPLVAALAEELLERALDEGTAVGAGALARLGRCGAWRTPAVERQTLVLLLRIRHQLQATFRTRDGSEMRRVLLVEEGVPAAIVGRQAPEFVTASEVLTWLETAAGSDLTPAARHRALEAGLQLMQAALPTLDAFAAVQSERLLADHRRVREAAGARGKYEVRPLTPVDVVGAFVLLPEA